MTYDLVRAWKEESYRQALSDEQRQALPANPAGSLELELELDATTLAAIYGGQPAASPFFADGPHSFNFEEFLHSFALVCDEAKFSLTTMKNVHTASPITIICINGDIR
jgi:mersacidin/lichenicidin family type 2 lantibiotic